LIDPIKEDVNVQHVDRMMEAGVALPDWLDGTPILVDTTEKKALRGTHAFEYLKNVSVPQVHTNQEEETDGFEGMLPDGEKYLHSSGGELEMEQPPNSAERQIIDQTREGKVTENDLQRYMELRNKST
jgi:hypothetical protein